MLAPLETNTQWQEKLERQPPVGADESEQHAPTGPMTRFRPVVGLNRLGPTDRQSARERVAFRGREERIRLSQVAIGLLQCSAPDPNDPVRADRKVLGVGGGSCPLPALIGVRLAVTSKTATSAQTGL